jgi:hypothetical protein
MGFRGIMAQIKRHPEPELSQFGFPFVPPKPNRIPPLAAVFRWRSLL